MSATSWRSAPLPPDWAKRRAHVLARDGHACQWYEPEAKRICGAKATDVDHMGDPNDHRPERLRSLCGWHHDRVTAKQAAAARARLPKMLRPSEKHPGLA